MRVHVILILSGILSFCGTKDSQREISLERAIVRPAAKGGTSAGYVTIRNHLTTPDALVGAACDCARVVELHRVLHEGLTMKMQPVSEVALPAGSEVRFEPHGLHMMLIGLHKDLSRRNKVKITLKFRSAPSKTIEAQVGEP